MAVALADGSAVLALVTPKPDREEYNLIGRSKQIVFVTEDVPAKFQEWSNRGVQFQHPPAYTYMGRNVHEFRRC